MPTDAAQDGLRLFLRGLAVQCRIGVHDFERTGPQRVLVDIDVWADRALAEAAAESDALADTLDYDRIRDGVQAIAGSRPFNTQEALCGRILAHCLATRGVRAARVATAKPDIYPDTAAVGVELFSDRPTWRTDGRSGGENPP